MLLELSHVPDVSISTELTIVLRSDDEVDTHSPTELTVICSLERSLHCPSFHYLTKTY